MYKQYKSKSNALKIQLYNKLYLTYSLNNLAFPQVVPDNKSLESGENLTVRT